MKKLTILLFFSLSLLKAQSPLIPAPVTYVPGQGSFTFKPGTSVSLSENTNELKTIADQLIKHPVAKGLSLVLKQATSNTIKLTLLPTPTSALGNEGYTLSVKPDQINISANKTAGLFYGIQSLMQLLPMEAGTKSISIPSCEITDYPRFGWRGLMLDVSRHFFTVNEVK